MRGGGGSIVPRAHPGEPTQPSPSASGRCGQGSAKGRLHTAVQPSRLLLLHVSGSKPLRRPKQHHCAAPSTRSTAPKTTSKDTDDASAPNSAQGEHETGGCLPGVGSTVHASSPMHCEQLYKRHASGEVLQGMMGAGIPLGLGTKPPWGATQPRITAPSVRIATSATTKETSPMAAGPIKTLRVKSTHTTRIKAFPSRTEQQCWQGGLILQPEPGRRHFSWMECNSAAT